MPEIASIRCDEADPTPSQAEHLLASLRAARDSERRTERESLVPFRLPEFADEAAVGRPPRDAQFDLTIELGHNRMPIEDASALGVGSVVTLDELPADPVDVHAGGRLIARGELVVMHDKLCVRITELIAQRAAA